MASRALVAAAAAACLVGCAGGDDATLMPPGDPPVLVYVGAATDEALARLLDQAAKEDAAHRLLVDTPAAGARLDADTPVTITFSSADTAAVAPRLRRPGRGPSVLAELFALFGPERRAHAHGTPFNGTGYLLQIDDAAKRVRLRVFTDQTSYTPPADLYAQLAAAAPQPLTLTITWAAFEANAIPADGGPFLGATVLLGHR